MITSVEGLSFKVLVSLVSVSQTSFWEAGDIACKAAYTCVILGQYFTVLISIRIADQC